MWLLELLLSLFLCTAGANLGQSHYVKHIISQPPHLQNGYILPAVNLSRVDRLSGKVQTVNILDFAGHTVSSVTAQLCPCSMIHKYMGLAVSQRNQHLLAYHYDELQPMIPLIFSQPLIDGKPTLSSLAVPKRPALALSPRRHPLTLA